MANNPFDQFDAASATPQATASAPASGNPFDQFDVGAPPSASSAAPGDTIVATPDRDQLGQLYWQATAQDDHDTAKRAFDLLRANGYSLPGPDAQGLQAIHAAYKPESQGAVPDFAVAAIHHLANLPVGLAQLGTHMAAGQADTAQDLLTGGPQKDLSSLITGQAPARNGLAGVLDRAASSVDQYAANRENEYQNVVPTNVSTTAGAGFGEILPWLTGIGELRAAGLLPQATNLAGRVGVGALEGGMMAAAQPVTNPNQDYLTQKAEQLGTGAVTGGALPAVTGGISALASKAAGEVSPFTQALADRAKQLGIDLIGPQISDSKPLKYLYSATSQLPFSGAGNFAAKQQQQFNNAVAKTIGLPGAEAITPDVFDKAVSQASSRFNTLWSNNQLDITPNVIGDMQSALRQVAQDTGPTSQITGVLRGVANRVINESQNSQLPGRTFQSIDTSLGRIVRNGGPEAHYAGQLQDALRDGMEQSMSPADAADLQDVRGIWQNIKTLTPIVAKAAGSDGNVSPSLLMGAIASSGIGKNALATGARGDLGDLAMIGQRFLKDQTRDSGTAYREAMYRALGTLSPLSAAGAAVPAVGAVPAAAGLAGTLGANRLLQSGLRSQALLNALGQARNGNSPALNNLYLAATRYALLPNGEQQNAPAQP